ncbi:MAG: 1-deoxy-D-xylulose-5-phosphate synthase [Nitrospinota bacterium]|nr:1-deoxy-D-xylulose-5-phosphate synthase [Nitrospinota bacterium]
MFLKNPLTQDNHSQNKQFPYELLPGIKGPSDLKGLSMRQLEKVADETRRRIIEVVMSRGGHLASSLGVVELTLALHYVYDTPKDKIVWDVGHQCYAHKILTGRNDRFDTLRQDGGISGFPSVEESPHDTFNTGHAGTSISAALGMAQARDIKGENHKVLAVIGDGSLTAGMAFEGLNHAGSLHTNFTVVLNDNKMSISKNVGALSQHLNRIITGKWFVKMQADWDQAMNAIAGEEAAHLSHKFREAVKGFIIPGKLFEDLGYKYIGPINGHEISYLVETFQAVRELNGPKLVHVVTTKGKGYQPAEEKAHSFHGVSPVLTYNGSVKKPTKAKTFTGHFSDAVIALAEKDPRVVAITAAMPEGTGLNKFAEKFPDRFFDVGIAEQHAGTFAAGLASAGLKPVVAIYSTFLQRVFDQILHDVCLARQDVTFAVDRAGVVGEDGVTHQGLFDLTYLRCAPDMVVTAPRDDRELTAMLSWAVAHPGPVALRYPRGEAPVADKKSSFQPVEIGKSELLAKGTDLCLLAAGTMAGPALEVAARLEADGVSTAVVNARFIKPLDQEMILSMARTCGRIITIEENVLSGGFGAGVLEVLEEGESHTHVKRIGAPDSFVEHGAQEIIRRRLGLDADGIERTTRRFLDKTGFKVSEGRPTTHAEKAAGHTTG